MVSIGRPRDSIRILQSGRARLEGRYILVVSEHPGFGSDEKGVLQY